MNRQATAARSGPASPRPALDRTGLALYAVTVLAWGTSWLPLKLQTGVVAPEISVLWRFLIAAAVMWAWVAVRGERVVFEARTHLRFAALGVLLFSSNFALFYAAAPHLPSGLLAVVFSLASMINLGLAALLLGTPPDARVLVGGLLGFAGVALMFAPQIAGGAWAPGAPLGLTLAVAGTLSFCLGNLVSAASQRGGVPLLPATAWGMTYGAAYLAAIGLLRGSAFTLEPTAAYLGSLLFLAVVASVLAFFCYLTLLGRIGAARAGYVTVLFPVVALAVSTVFEGYAWTISAALGLVLVLAGNVLVLSRRP